MEYTTVAVLDDRASDTIATEDRPYPQWAVEIADKHHLHDRADEPMGDVIVLLMDAAHDLDRAARQMATDDAATPDTVRCIADAVEMAQDALTLSTICRRTPTPGILEEQSEGSFVRRAKAVGE